MNEVLVAMGALVLGLALRTLLPYVVAGLTVWQESGDWSAWPRFEPKYLASFALAAVGYAVTFATVEGAFESVAGMSFVAIVALAYGSTDVAREAIKLVVRRLR